jgi:hypothetical protein
MYVYICSTGHRFQSRERGLDQCPKPDCPTPTARRDWRAEGVGIGEGVRESRKEMSNSGYRDLFLPTAEDMMSADDPTGQKGLREWAETHGPREDNKRPMYPEMDKRVFATS